MIHEKFLLFFKVKLLGKLGCIKYVRYHSTLYGIDAFHIGITGTSSGGNLALIAATADDIGDQHAKDPIERISSRVQAVAVFCPPTDFLNNGQAGFNPTTNKELLKQLDVLGAFTYTSWDSETRVFLPITDEAKRFEITTKISPAEMVTAGDPPVNIMHGDNDKEVPSQQSQLIRAKLIAAGVPVALTLKGGAGHGWKNMIDDEKEFVKWFDKYLLAGH